MLAVLLFPILFFLPGFLLERALIRSKEVLQTLIFSFALSFAWITIICPVLDLVWEISLPSVLLTTFLFTLPLFLVVRRTHNHFIAPQKWEIVTLLIILFYGILLRSYTLTDTLPEGQDAWRHLSFILYTYETHALPSVLPWAEPPTPVTLIVYPPGTHCIGALLSSLTGGVSFIFLKIFFISVGTASALSSYVVFKDLLGRKIALLSSFLIAAFIPHMLMTSEIIAQATAIFIFPLIPYFFYKQKLWATVLLLSGVMLTHHITALAAVISLAVLGMASLKKKHLFYFLGVSILPLLVTFPWWSQVPISFTYLDHTITPGTSRNILFNLYLEMVSPLFIFLSMVGFFFLLKESKFLKERERPNFFLIVWGITLFLASQPTPAMFHNHRFLAFFVFPCSAMAAEGILKLRKMKRELVFLLVVFSLIAPPHFWPTTGRENGVAAGWVEENTLDSFFYCYGEYYAFLYPLSSRKLYDITNFDDPFDYETPAYFYDDAAWLPHDMTRFGDYDNIYSCRGVIILRVE